MSGLRSNKTRRHDALDAPTAPSALRIGAYSLPVAAVAWGLSAALHGGILTATWYFTLTPPSHSEPQLMLAKGEQAVRITILQPPPPQPPQPTDRNHVDEEEQPDDDASVETDPRTTPEQPVVTPTPSSDTPAESNQPASDRPSPPPPPKRQTNPPPPPDTESAPPSRETVMVESPMDPIEIAPDPRWIRAAVTHWLQRVDEFLARARANRRVTPDPLPAARSAIEPPVPPVETDLATSDAPPTHPPQTPAEPGVETGVEVLNLPTPVYPPMSRRRGEEGLVVLRVEVLPDGTIGQITVLEDPGHPRLIRAAIRAVRGARFKPATHNGHTVRSDVRIPFRFVLQGLSRGADSRAPSDNAPRVAQHRRGAWGMADARKSKRRRCLRCRSAHATVVGATVRFSPATAR